MNTRTLFATFALVTGALPLAAQATEAGVQASVLFPQLDLRSAGGGTGFQVGVHAAVDLQGGAELRPRIDYTRVAGGAFSFNSFSSTNTIQAISLEADYLRYLEGESRRGLYGVAGIGLVWWESQYRFAPNTRLTSPSLMIGVGHRFNSSVSMEFSLDYGQFQPAAGTASSIKAGLFYRF